MRARSLLAAALVLAALAPALHAASTSNSPEYQKRVEAMNPNDPQQQETLAIWCRNRNMEKGYARHHLLFLEARGKNTRVRDSDGYCRTCNGQGEHVCDLCNTKRRANVECSKCEGAGKVTCPTCKGKGKGKCHLCRGKGYRKKKYLATGSGGHWRTRTVDCPTELRCGKCRGKKQNKCWPCGGKGVKKGDCTACDKYRFRKCSECAERRKKLGDLIQNNLHAADEVPLSDKEELVTDEDLDGDSLIEKGNDLLAEGMALDKQIFTADNPYPIIKKTMRKYQGAVSCYKAAQENGSDTKKKLEEATTRLYWLKEMISAK